MEISPMPPISEDCSSQGESELGDEGDSNFEQLMVSMLEERDKLQESLRDTQDLLQSTITRLQEVEKERNAAHAQLDRTYPPELLVLTRENAQLREQLAERDEEIHELKAERNNTRLLLEHLESLVARHEKSLRMTVVKRQTQLSSANSNSSGVSSEAEVLKALKSLFEHHKALDERYRERYKAAIEKCNVLEEELDRTRADLKIERETKSLSTHYFETIEHNLNKSASLEQAAASETSTQDSGGDQPPSTDVNVVREPSLAARIIELQNVLEKQSKELAEARVRCGEAQTKLREVEQTHQAAEERHARDSSVQGEQLRRVQRELKELTQVREEQEQRVASAEQRCAQLQREQAHVHEQCGRLEAELAVRENALKGADERLRSLQVMCDTAEQKYDQLLKKQQQMQVQQSATAAANNSKFSQLEIKGFCQRGVFMDLL
jgi:chromosome segregation ATPase